MAKTKKPIKVAPTAHPPRLGAMSNLFRGSPSEVAEILRGYGLDTVQILPNFPGIRFASAEEVTTELCRQMGDPFVAIEMEVAAVSAHTNFLDPDRDRRKRMVKRFDALIEHCRDFSTPYLVTETGTLNPNRPWDSFPENHLPETLQNFIKALKPSVKLAEKVGVTLLLEGHLHHVVASAENALVVREELGPNVGYVMDPTNYFTKSMANASTKALRQLFEAIGSLCPIAHAKDVRYVGSELTTPRAGIGNLDYKEFLELLDKNRAGCPLILEQIRPGELRETIDFIDRFFD